MDRESNYTERTFFQGQPTGTGFEGRRAEIIHPTIAAVSYTHLPNLPASIWQTPAFLKREPI